MVRVLVVDDDPAVRLMIKTFLESEDAFQVVGEAGTCAEALQLGGEVHPDLVTMDHDMPGGSGTDCIVEMKKRWPGVHVLALTADSQAVQGMLDAGAYAKVDKTLLEAVVPALYQVADRRSGDRRRSEAGASSEQRSNAKLREAIAAAEAQIARSIAEKKTAFADRFELIVALRAVLCASTNPKYSSDEALSAVTSLAAAILGEERYKPAV